MKREIVCEKCRASWASFIGEYPGEYIKIIDGKLLHDANCDSCNKELRIDTPASAVSLYTDTTPYFEWEHGYLQEAPSDDKK